LRPAVYRLSQKELVSAIFFWRIFENFDPLFHRSLWCEDAEPLQAEAGTHRLLNFESHVTASHRKMLFKGCSEFPIRFAQIRKLQMFEKIFCVASDFFYELVEFEKIVFGNSNRKLFENLEIRPPYLENGHIYAPKKFLKNHNFCLHKSVDGEQICLVM
jgi:hypothetical protein